MAGHNHSNFNYYFILARNVLIMLVHTIITLSIVLRRAEWMRIGF
jgi:hypothetical protein